MITYASKAHACYVARVDRSGVRDHGVLAFFYANSGSVSSRNEVLSRLRPCAGDGSVWHARIDGIYRNATVTTSNYPGGDIPLFFYKNMESSTSGMCYECFGNLIWMTEWYKLAPDYWQWIRTEIRPIPGTRNRYTIRFQARKYVTYSSTKYAAGASPNQGWVHIGYDPAEETGLCYETIISDYDGTPCPSCTSLFKYRELDQIWNTSVDWGIIAPLILPCQAAYVSALEKIPKAHNNTIANILELVYALKRLHGGDFTSLQGLIKTIALPSNGSDLWLQTRYRVGTTISDSKEYYSLIRRLVGLSKSQTQVITCYGIAYRGNAVIRCEVKCTKNSAYTQGLSDFLSIAGVNLSLENVWDLVPYSFVVDWFTHLSSWLAKVDTELSSGDESWHVGLPVFSVSNVATGLPPGLSGSSYCRFYSNMRTLTGYCWYDDQSQASSNTILRRIFDGVSLILQRL